MPPNQSQIGSWPTKQVRASRPKRFAAMLGFLTVFSATLAGYAGVAPWAIAVAAIGLASISYTQYYKLYERGQELGFGELVEATLLRSFFNALMAAAAAYGLGWFIRVL